MRTCDGLAYTSSLEVAAMINDGPKNSVNEMVDNNPTHKIVQIEWLTIIQSTKLYDIMVGNNPKNKIVVVWLTTWVHQCGLSDESRMEQHNFTILTHRNSNSHDSIERKRAWTPHFVWQYLIFALIFPRRPFRPVVFRDMINEWHKIWHFITQNDSDYNICFPKSKSELEFLFVTPGYT